MKDPRQPSSFLPLTPAEFHILLALAPGELHGYGIMQEVARRTRGEVQLVAGTLYGSIKRMVSSGLIEECEERGASESDDDRRRYYQMTELGRRVAAVEAERLEGLVRTARASKILRDKARSR
jgi:DNA-binding PadR family transcriptional regulator